MKDAEAKAREIVSWLRGSFNAADGEMDRVNYVASVLLKARNGGLEEAAKLCETERVRQVNGDHFERLNGQDTAFSLMQSIRSLKSGAGEEGR